MINIDKKSVQSIDEFEAILDSERIAFQVYKIIVVDKLEREYVDTIANTCCSFCIDLDRMIPALVKAKKILNEDYDVDMYSLPFFRQDIKLEVERLDLVNELENYLKENNISFEHDKIVNKGYELSSTNSNIKSYIDKIELIDSEIISLDNKKIDI